MLKNNRVVKYIHLFLNYISIYPRTFTVFIRLHLYSLEANPVPYWHWSTASY